MNASTEPEWLRPHEGYPVDSREANLLALGIQQLARQGRHWNDPTASTISEAEKRHLRESWRLRSTADVLIAAHGLVNDRHRHPEWRRLLELRVDAADPNRTSRPSARSWLRAIERAGVDGDGSRAFVSAVSAYEEEIGRSVLPSTEPVISLDAYPLGRAVAVSVWGVGLGLLPRTKSLQLIDHVNGIARREFDSWEAFGRSYALGSAMASSDGVFRRRGSRRADAAARIMSAALDATLEGPWAVLPWRI